MIKHNNDVLKRFASFVKRVFFFIRSVNVGEFYTVPFEKNL